MTGDSINSRLRDLRVAELSCSRRVLTANDSVLLSGVLEAVDVDVSQRSDPNEADARRMDEVCAWADQNNTRLGVDLREFKNGSAVLGRLIAWYGLFGFTTLNGTAYLSRAPRIQELLEVELRRVFCDVCSREEHNSGQRGTECGQWADGMQCRGRLVSAYQWTLKQSRTGEVDPEVGILSGFAPSDFDPYECRCVFDENGVVYCLKAYDDGTFVWLDEIKAHVRGRDFGRLAMRRFCKWLTQHNASAGLRIGNLGTDSGWLDLFYRGFGFRRDLSGTYRRYPDGRIPQEDRLLFERDDEQPRRTWIDQMLRRLGLRRLSSLERTSEEWL